MEVEMGLNVDLCHMLGAPKEVSCPDCGALVQTDFDDYDIQYGNPNPAKGEWELSVYCRRCDYAWKLLYEVNLQEA